MKTVACDRQGGSALIMALFLSALLASLGFALLFLSATNLRMSRAYVNTKKAFFLAESGVEDGRRVLYIANGASEAFDARLADAAGGNHRIDFDSQLLRGVYDDRGGLVGFTGYGDDVPLRDASVLGDGMYAAFLSNDPLDGRMNPNDSNSRVMVTGVGAGPNQSLKIVETIVEPEVFLPPVPPAAVTVIGSDPYFYGGQSHAESYHGEDCYFLGGGNPDLHVAVVGATNAHGEATVEEGMSGQPAKYRSGSFSGAATGVDLTDADDPLLSDAGLQTVDPRWLDCHYLETLVDRLRDYATYYCDSDSCTLPESATDDDVVFIEGAAQVGPGYVGSGVLVVTGELVVLGNSSWSGIILAIGEGSVRRVGGGNGTLSGSTIVADIAGPNGTYGDADDCQPAVGGEHGETPAGDPFGNSSYQVVGGGNSDIDYCSRFLFTAPRTYRVVEFRQL